MTKAKNGTTRPKCKEIKAHKAKMQGNKERAQKRTPTRLKCEEIKPTRQKCKEMKAHKAKIQGNEGPEG